MAPLPQEAAPTRVPRGDVALLAGAASVVLVDVASLVASGLLLRSPASTVTFATAEVGLVLASATAWRRAGQHPNARLMAALAGVNGTVDLLGAWPEAGPAAFVSGIAYWYGATMFGHLVLRWPDAHVRSPLYRAVLAVGYGVLPLLTLAWQLLWDKRWFGPSAARWWWPSLLPNRDVAATTWEIGQILFLVLVVAVVGLAVGRAVRASRERRRELLPVTVAAALLGAAAIATTVVGLVATVPDALGAVQNLAILTVPAAVLASGGRRAPRPVAPAGSGAGTVAAAHPWWLVLGASLAAVAVLLALRLTTAAAADEGVPDPQPLPAPAVVGPR